METGLRQCDYNHKGEFLMSLKKIAICATALVIATVGAHLAQAGGRGTPNLGVSASSPGHQEPSTKGPTEPGQSQFAPGDVKQDKNLPNASSVAPGSANPNSKK